MPLSTKQRDVLKLMRNTVQSYRTLSIGSAHGLQRLARDYFNTDIDIQPTIEAVGSRRGDKIYEELKRLQDVINAIEKQASA
jgi:FlaA1/EpsC-like NDP-sugar epimerase